MRLLISKQNCINLKQLEIQKPHIEVVKAEGSEYERNKQKYMFGKKEKHPDE